MFKNVHPSNIKEKEKVNTEVYIILLKSMRYHGSRRLFQAEVDQNLGFLPAQILIHLIIQFGVLRRACKACKKSTQVSDLSSHISRAWNSMSRKHLISTCQAFRPRLEFFIEKNGDLIES